jgi:hypothetical protein
MYTGKTKPHPIHHHPKNRGGTMGNIITTITIIIAMACAIETTTLNTCDTTSGDPGGLQLPPPSVK